MAAFAPLLLLLAGCGNAYYQGPVTDHFDGETFHNLGGTNDKTLKDFLAWRLSRNPQPWPDEVPVKQVVPAARVSGDALRVTRINHSTVLIQTQGLNILTDPVWAERASPFDAWGPARVHPPAVRFPDLPQIDLVIVSHNHYDHLDLPTLADLWQRHRPRIVMPLGNDAVVHEEHPEIAVETYDWGESCRIAPGVTLSLLPMQHWSARGLFDRDEALWAAYAIEMPGGSIYFAGDTGYGDGDEFRIAARRHGPFRLAILPIGDYDPHWFMAYKHMTPEEAVRATGPLDARHALAHHYGTFPLADTPYGEAPKRLIAARDAAGMPNEAFRALTLGVAWDVPHHAAMREAPRNETAGGG